MTNLSILYIRCPPGVYAIKPPLPAVGGGEGVGVVTKVGSEVSSFEEGDWVIPATPGMGMYVYCLWQNQQAKNWADIFFCPSKERGVPH